MRGMRQDGWPWWPVRAEACWKRRFEAGADTLVTGDIKHDRFVEAENRGINLVEWNHYDAEHLVLFGLKERLEAAFSVPVVLLREDNILQSV